jgi:methionine-S-sulfoxide reductase
MFAPTHDDEYRLLPSLDAVRPAATRTATFALGWFWGPDARFGSLPGVVRTRVGYAGGTTADPTYHALGDHTETVEIDYDPSVVSYRELLDVFWQSHDPRQTSPSVQYRSAVLYRTEEEHVEAQESLERVRRAAGRLFTSIEPLSIFHRAEDYHQKYRLRSRRDFMAEYRAMYPADRDFVDSTSAARVNGWLDGYGSDDEIANDLPRTGLSNAAQRELQASIDRSRRGLFARAR